MTTPSQIPEGSAPALSSDAQIDAACDEFESALRAGKQPSIEDYLERVAAPDRPRFFVELLYVEFEFQPPPAGDDAKAVYISKYPEFASRINEMSFVDEATDTTPYHRPAGAGTPRPRAFANFQLEELLGTGAMGEVWKAYDPQLDRWVAVKIPRRAFASDEEARRFVREGRAAAQLRHPNIVQVHEVAHAAADLYIVSDYIEGGDLRTYLDANRLSFATAVELSATIARALHFAHNRDIIHRDLKPANVLMDAEGQPHLTDFGLAKWSKDAAEMTVSGQVLGTPAYMSPEQARGRAAEVDRRSDVYALGVLLYEMITGRLPFTGDVTEVLRAIADAPPKSPRSIRPEIPRDLATICLKAMEKEPARRYSTALDLADDLDRFRAGDPISARPVSAVEKSWRWCKRRPATAVSLLLVLLLICAGLIAARERAEYRAAADVRDIVMDTEPSGAEVIFVPLNDHTGIPEPLKLIRAGSSPISLGLAAGDYLVVAAHSNGKFHEVFRHVPGSDEGQPGGADPYFFVPQTDGTIRLYTVTLWSNDQLRDMQSVSLRSSTNGSDEHLLVDTHEMRGGELESGFATYYELKPDQPLLCDLYLAMYVAEKAGKRLPTDSEFRQILAGVDVDRPGSFEGLFSEPWEWSSTSPISMARHSETDIFLRAILRDSALVFGGSTTKQGRTIKKIADEPAAIRAVRSAWPRLRAEDFALPEPGLDLDIEGTGEISTE